MAFFRAVSMFLDLSMFIRIRSERCWTETSKSNLAVGDRISTVDTVPYWRSLIANEFAFPQGSGRGEFLIHFQDDGSGLPNGEMNDCGGSIASSEEQWTRQLTLVCAFEKCAYPRLDTMVTGCCHLNCLNQQAPPHLR